MNDVITREIYLDLDGVCVDLFGAAVAAHGFDPQTVLKEWASRYRGEFYPYRVLHMEKDPFWDRITQLGESFWAELEPFPWFEDLYDGLRQHGNVVFCSSSNREPTCLSGKLRWLQERFGSKFQDYIFTYHKDRLAHSNAFLVDDYDVNIDRFRTRGGNGILFPQIWNSNHSVSTNPVEYVLEKMER